MPAICSTSLTVVDEIHFEFEADAISMQFDAIELHLGGVGYGRMKSGRRPHGDVACP